MTRPASPVSDPLHAGYVRVLWISALIWAAFAVRFWVAGAWPAACVDGAAAALLGGMWLVYGPLRRPFSGVHVAVAINTGALVLVTPLTGGSASTAPMFLLGPPLFVSLYLGVRPGVRWAVVCVLGVVVAYVLPAPPDVPIFQPDTPLFDVLAIVMVGAWVALEQRRMHDAQVAALDQARRDALEASGLKQRLLATVSHELRTPLAGSLGIARLLQPELSANQQQRMQTIIDCSEQLEGLLDDLLDQAALMERGVRVSLEASSPRDLLDGVVALLQPHPGVQVHVHGTAPRVILDPKRVRQIWMNLLGNAVKFTREGCVTATLTWHDEQLTLVVEDTGVGIEHLDRVMLPFEQDNAEISQRYGGTGLGLSISKALCEALEGSLTLESVVGQGTTATAMVVAPALPSRSLRVLLIEDNPVNARVALRMLATLGHQTAWVERAEDALNGDLSVDVVLLDLRLPGLSGTDALDALRGVRRDVPVIAVTANAEERETCMRAGMNGFLAKPFRLAALEATLSVL